MPEKYFPAIASGESVKQTEGWAIASYIVLSKIEQPRPHEATLAHVKFLFLNLI